MEHWRTPYLGLREIPAGLDDFELTTFFSYSATECRIIDARRQSLHRLALALHIGFIRMAGRTLDIFERIPKRLWVHISNQIGATPLELASLRSLYTTRVQTLYDHQQIACDVLGFKHLSEHQRRYVVRWLREALAGGSEHGSLLPDLKRWFYEHGVLLVADRELKRLITGAQRDHEKQLTDTLNATYGEKRLAEWDLALTTTREDGTPVQSWLWAAPRKHSTRQMSELFQKIDHLRNMGVHESWPALLNDATVRRYGRRCANRPPSAGKRITSTRRPLEVGCFLRYALCTTSDQLLLMLRRWIRQMVNTAARATEPKYADSQTRLRELAQSVRDLATNTALDPEALKGDLITLADNALRQAKVSRAALGRAYLMAHPHQARIILARLLTLPFEADEDRSVIDALTILRTLYADKSTELPPQAHTINLGRRWQEAMVADDGAKALAAFEWATLLKLRVALRNGAVYLAHSFAFRGHAS